MAGPCVSAAMGVPYERWQQAGAALAVFSTWALLATLAPFERTLT